MNAEVVLGTDTEGPQPSSKKDLGIQVLKAACLPMNIPQGILLTVNPFNLCWQELEEWAANEELVLSIRADQDLFFARTVYCLVARPR